MVRWIWGLLWRGFLFWSIWMGGLFLMLLSVIQLDHIPPGLLSVVVRGTLFVSVAILLFSEWSVLNRALLRATAALKEAEVAAPSRLEWWTHGCTALALATPTWGVLLTAMSLLSGEQFSDGNAVGVIVIRTLFWTVSSLLVMTLVLGGVSLARFRARLRRLPADARPKLPALLPWTVAAWSTGCLAFVLLGFPSLRTMLLGGQLALFAAHLGAGAEPGESELLVELGEDDKIEEVLHITVWYGARLWPAFPEHTTRPDIKQTWRLTVSNTNANALANALQRDRENVDFVELNSSITVARSTPSTCDPGWRTMPVNDPLSSGQHALRRIDGASLLSNLSQRQRPARPAIVGVIDTGIDGQHADLRQVVQPAIRDDQHGHGTMVAGLIGAVGNNREGLTSFNLGGDFIKLRSYPAMASGQGDALRIADAILDATEDGVDVINMSFSAPGTAPRVVSLAVEEALEAGLIVVASAGNDPNRRASQQWPANLPGVIVVGALDEANQTASFSSPLTATQRGVLAPGEQVCSLSAGGGYQRYSGTSVAAPIVAGMLGVARALCPNLPASSASTILTGYGDRLDASGFIGRLRSHCR